MKAEEVGNLSVMCGISPFAVTAFSSPTVITNVAVTKEEQDNYLEYLTLSGKFENKI